MTSNPSQRPENEPDPVHGSTIGQQFVGQGEVFEFQDLLSRLSSGIYQIAALSLLGLVIAAVATFIGSKRFPVATTVQVIFSFPGFEKGEYPDHSKFQADDLLAPDIISEALKRQRLDATHDFQSTIRGALIVEGIISPAIAKVQERLRANGQTPPFYIPDEYKITLSLPRNFPLSISQREHLLDAIISIYRENFQKTYADAGLLLNFGNAFESLKNADYPEYEMILSVDIDNANHFLNDQIGRSRTFRSPTTNLTFSDLRTQMMLFSRIRMNEVLGLIYANGLARDRAMALVRIDYYLKTLQDEVAADKGEEQVYTDLLTKVGDRGQNYVLGIKAQAVQPVSQPAIIDKGLIDSLVANDIFNSLVRQAIDMGLRTKRAQAAVAQLTRQRDAFVRADAPDQSTLIAEVQKSLGGLELTYSELIASIRATYADFEQQQYADAIRVTSQISTDTMIRTYTLACGFGAALGFFAGCGLSLIGIYIGRQSRAKTPV